MDQQPELIFEPGAHRYFLGERELPAVTRIMEDAGIVDFSRVKPDILETARQRGTAVHVACALYDQGTLDYASLADESYGYLAAWILFRHQTGFEPSIIEKRLCTQFHGYAGTIDRAGSMSKAKTPAIIDIKTGLPGDDAPGIQLAAYECLMKEADLLGSRFRRIAVHLTPDGKYRMEPHENPNDFPVFLSALTLYHYKRRKK